MNESDMVNFRNKAEVLAEKNLKEFILNCKEQLSGNLLDNNWESNYWKKIFKFSKFKMKNVKLDSLSKSEGLDSDYLDFCKSYVAYVFCSNSKGFDKLTFPIVLRVIEKNLLNYTASGDIKLLNPVILDECLSDINKNYTNGVAYSCGKFMERLVAFLNEKEFLNCGLMKWSSYIRPPESRLSISDNADNTRLAKLPNERALRAIGEIFSMQDYDLHERDLFVTSVFALLMCAPSRITEILSLRADCEIVEKNRKGKECYGLRFYSLKGFGANIKWIPEIMVPTARLAIKRLLRLSEKPRLRSKILEEEMRKEGGGEIWFDKEKDVRFSNALCALFDNQLSMKRQTGNDLFKITNTFFSKELGYSKISKHKNLFERHGYHDEDNKPLFLRTHQARHLLNTLAQRGGLGELDIAKWSGRVSITQNRVYNHITEDEMIEKVKALGVNQKDIVPCNSDVNDNFEISTIHELKNKLEHGAVHTTEYGYCVHDYILAPCSKYFDCINCSEQVCVKGEKQKLERLRALLETTEDLVDKAKGAISEEELRADKWYQHQTKTLERVKGIIALMENPELPDGSLVRTHGDDFSHLSRVLEMKKDDSIIINNKEKIHGQTPNQ
ncbi:Transposase B from transposon Tn554 [Pantoea vagans C9-1]|uniref:transposase n=1 Tax=Pantoea vagans TaxID=470934 RepID=UPI0001E59758|nr:transposase [Pantoea vagans]ADO10594.1 Transposase B from transposon Tn554 [Pantoea vagans C9-1]